MHSKRLLASFAGLAGFLVLAFGSSAPERSVTAKVGAGAKVGVPIAIDLAIANGADTVAHVTHVKISGAVSQKLEITGGTPGLGAPTTGSFDDVEYPVAFDVPAGKGAFMKLTAVPTVGGKFNWPIQVCFSQGGCSQANLNIDIDGPKDVPTAYSVEVPEKVAVGDDFVLAVKIKNDSPREEVLLNLTLDDIVEAASVQSIDPEPISEGPGLLGGTEYNFQRPVPGQTELVVKYHLHADKPVRLDEYVNICVESELLCKQPEYKVRID